LENSQWEKVVPGGERDKGFFKHHEQGAETLVSTLAGKYQRGEGGSKKDRRGREDESQRTTDGGGQRLQSISSGGTVWGVIKKGETPPRKFTPGVQNKKHREG